MKIVFVVMVIQSIVLCRDLSESERTRRAEFVQRLLNKNKKLEGRIRLVGGPSKFEDPCSIVDLVAQSNVYIYHAGRWGAVCDDSWDHAAAHVVCRGLNRSGLATHGGQYGEATEKYWMDDVVCEGGETHLSRCIFSGWGATDCDTSEVAGVICFTDRNVGSLKKIAKKRLFKVINIAEARLRLVGGRSKYEGRVEMLYKRNWGSICPDGFTLYEASTICRQLNLGFAEQALQTDLFGTSKLVMSGLHCEGNETNMYMCDHQDLGNVVCPGKAGHVAAVVCTWKLADLSLDTTALESTAHLQDVPMYQLKCAMEENCLSRTAYEIQQDNPDWQFETRRLLRFTASSLNVGNEEFRPYLPKHLWQWHLCHMHYHSMEVFATFDILDSSGRRVAEGHKASFCLEDNTCLPGVERKYSCKNYGDQGISVNCSDVYHYNIDCQWVDVTDLQTGDYTFKVAINPHARIAEQSYHNNAAICQLRLADTYASVYKCHLMRP